MKGEFRFGRLSIRGCPPVGDLQVSLRNGVTVIVGGSASGKTTVFEALRGVRCLHGGVAEVEIFGDRNPDLDKLVFVDDRALFSNILSVMPKRLAPELGNSAYLECCAQVLSEDRRLNPGHYRYATTSDSDEVKFCVTAGEEGEVVVHVGDQGSGQTPQVASVFFDPRRASAGRKAFMRIVQLVALRRHLRVDAPLVGDGILGVLDASYMQLVISLLSRCVPQLVLICSEGERTGARPYLEGATLIKLASR